MSSTYEKEQVTISLRIGKIFGYCGSVIMPFLGLLVIHSASHTNMYILIVSILIVSFAIILFVRDIRSAKSIQDILGEYHLLMLYYGGLQLVLWVIDYQNPIHEPRTVLLLGLGGIIAYINSQNTKGD